MTAKRNGDGAYSIVIKMGIRTEDTDEVLFMNNHQEVTGCGK